MKLRIRNRRETQPGLERQSETSVFVVRNGSRSLAQVAAQQKRMSIRSSKIWPQEISFVAR